MLFAKVFFYALLSVLFIPVSVSLLVRTPMVQTIITRVAVQWLTSKTGYNVAVGRLQITPLGAVDISNVTLLSPASDTIVNLEKLHLLPQYSSLLKNKIVLHKVFINNVDFRLVQQKGSDDFDFIKFIDSFSTNDTMKSEGSSKKFVLKIKHLKIENSHFVYSLKDEPPAPEGLIDFSALDVEKFDLEAVDFSIVDDSLHFKLKLLRGKDKSGLEIENMKSEVTISNTMLAFMNTGISTQHSRISLDFAMNTRTWNSYDNFYDSVFLTADIKNSEIDNSELGYFVEGIKSMKNRVYVKGNAEGCLRNLSVSDLSLNYGSNTSFYGDVKVKGLPDITKSYFNINIDNFITGKTDLETLKLPVGKLPYLEYVPQDETVNIKGKLNGKIDDFDANLDILLDSGSITAEVSMKPLKNGFLMNAELGAKALNLGRYLQTGDLLGKTTFNTNAEIRSENNSAFVLNAGTKIDYIEVSDYKFDNITLESSYQNDTLKSNFAIGDKDILATGKVKILFNAIPELDLKTKILNSNLYAFDIFSQEKAKLSTDANIHVKGFDIDSMLADITMKNTKLWFGDDWYLIKNISLEKYFDKKNEVLSLTSDIVDFEMSGHFKYSNLSSDFTTLYNYYFMPPAEQTALVLPGGNINFKILLKDPSIIGEQFVNGLEISNGTSLKAEIDFKNASVSFDGNSDLVKYEGIDFRKPALNSHKEKNGLKINLSADNIILKDSTGSDKTVFGLDQFVITTALFQDSIRYSVNWNNADTVRKNWGDIKGKYLVSDNNSLFKIDYTKVFINDTLWTVDSGNQFIIDTSGIKIEDFVINRGTSSFSMKGKIPEKEMDTLKLVFHNWDLSNFDFVTMMWDLDLDGIIDGNMNYSLGKNKFWFVSDMKISGLYFNKVLLGDAVLLNTWDNSRQAIFVKSQIVRKGNSGIGKVFALDGFIYPFDDKNNFNIKVAFNRFNIKAIEPFIDEYITQIEGKAAGNMEILGTFDKPVVKGFVDFKRTALKINYLNTKYSFSNKIVFDENKIDFGSMILYDTLGNSATLSGGLYHNYFKNIHFDLTVHSDKFLFFDTNRHQNELYYGVAIASGNIVIKGPPDDITLNIDAQSKKGTDVVIPLDYSAEILDKNYIVFVPPKTDSSELHKESKKNVKEQVSKYDIKLNMSVNPDADIKITLPYEMGDIRAAGKGNVKIHTNSDGDFTMVGDYIIDNGDFNLNIQNLVSKHFSLTKGSKISWSGDPYAAIMNIKGLYTVKTSYSSLGMVVDSSASYKNRLNVNCYIILSGSLSNPDMSFQIKFPDLDPDMQRIVYAKIDTTNKALVNQQMISLLVLGTFSFSNASNISLSSSYYTILSNQLSGLLSKVSKDLDIGINYKPGDNISQEEFEVALSTQLFDNRLSINGNFGMTYDRSNRSASNIVGDVDINFKLTPDGRWILKAYNHSNVNSWYYYANYDKVAPYTQGVGIAYQKDFNNFSELFRNPEKRKKKKKKTKSKR